MTPTWTPPRDDDGVDALVTDHYLAMLLAAAERGGAAEDPSGADDADVPDDELRRAGAVMRASLVRVHPSFRFEERLAARLASMAAGDASAGVAVAAGGRRGDVIPFPGAAITAAADDPLLDAVLEGRLDPADESAVARAAGLRAPARPLLVGGAITSAAISLVGVAWVAWRAARPAGSTMSRAAHAAHARRLAELAAGIHGGPA